MLGPTNTGKTHLAVERMLAHGTGMIGLPLRLLAREIYDRMVREKGARACALVTGEEAIRPEGARYFACTVEAMPVSEYADFIAVDEIQLSADPDRGHVFTDRILNARGRHETLLLGSEIMRPALAALELSVGGERRERFSRLSYSGPTKITKLPKRSAIVAFSAEEVYAIAELLKRQRGGCAVIMGALSPRTRNAQVDLYQSGEVDYIVATDAIGMGLNMDVGHVAFASRRKFDGHRRRALRADEAAQIAGRAGRFRTDGTFGETADCEPFEEETVERIENHVFEPADHLNWRNSNLDYGSVDSLLASLRRPAPHVVLRRAPEALDETTLAALAADPGLRASARTTAHVRRLWDVCTLPDFRKSGPEAHHRLVSGFLEKISEPSARIKDEWMHDQVERLDRTEGDIDTLQQRLAAIRTWTYAANRRDWLENAETWRGRTREIEDKLSDALHEKLLARFVDRRTSALLRTLNSEDDTPAEVDAEGAVSMGGHVIGRLIGLRFMPDASGQTLEGRALRNAAVRGLRAVIERRLLDIEAADANALSLTIDPPGVAFAGAPVARLSATTDWLNPSVALIGADGAHAGLRERARARIEAWLRGRIAAELAPLNRLREALAGTDLSGAARGIAYQLAEAGAAYDRRPAAHHGTGGLGADTLADLDGEDREGLRAAGVRSGRIASWLPDLLKPGPARLALALRSVFDGQPAPEPPTTASFALPAQGWNDPMLLTAGYLRLGPRAVRADMAERLAWTLAQARRAAGSAAFAAPAELAALIGCPAGDFPAVLRALGLKPAQRGAAAGEVAMWRFASTKRVRTSAAPAQPVGAFASLAEFAAARAPAAPAAASPGGAPAKRRRRRIRSAS